VGLVAEGMVLVKLWLHISANEQAIQEMLRRTDHEGVPWHVAAESKPPARLAVLETVIAALDRGLRAAGEEPVTTEAEL
jgi:polyphosphate kinase 2 (PPK2 family)